MIAFIKLVVSLTIVNDDPSLMIINEEMRREETDLKGIGTYHLVALKKASRSFSSTTTFYMHKTTFNKATYLLMTIFFRKL